MWVASSPTKSVPLLSAEQHAVPVVGMRAGDDPGVVAVGEHPVNESTSVVQG
jgi:hypothetical protein